MLTFIVLVVAFLVTAIIVAQIGAGNLPAFIGIYLVVAFLLFKIGTWLFPPEEPSWWMQLGGAILG
ncbi:hypothetical protein LF599_02550 [Pseudodesulfovibrio thermohalotolerans]|uniref:hypothetical protein n=1 Tax=Pseudodesulfovibrio thermohalotolerans TaxID=2880651 RepID=UPI0022BA0E35|nr:hypothetical protein [Pseudodesulfovibrio thermohalotolerans]WFS63057.1 hypothetical protein LF599_02550 [Pseudodesulfovibrio thermohalotolerans]